MIKTHRVLIPALVLVTAVAGSAFTAMGVSDWYPSLNQPELSPPNWVFGPVWTVIYILSAISAIIFWDQFGKFKTRRLWIKLLFGLNLLLNLFWSYLFFVEHQVKFALVELSILNLTTLALIILLWPISRPASALLIPYFLWVCFAGYLNYMFMVLNPTL